MHMVTEMSEGHKKAFGGERKYRHLISLYKDAQSH